ncbi:MAG: hypothetical protein PHY05_12170 [Methanothrix sp.]|nr:hypothetical protein [Methanothrix sp.]
MKTKIALAIMALAMVCLSLAPAMAAPFDGNKDRCNASMQRGGFGGLHDWMLLVDDATRENFDNMTLNQFKELRDEKIAELENMTVAQIDELHQKQMEKLGNMTLAQIRDMKMDRMGEMGPGMMGNGNGCESGCQQRGRR